MSSPLPKDWRRRIGRRRRAITAADIKSLRLKAIAPGPADGQPPKDKPQRRASGKTRRAQQLAMNALARPEGPAPTRIEIRVIADPKGQPRLHHYLVKSPRGRDHDYVDAFTPNTADEFKKAIRRAVRPFVTRNPMEGFVSCSIDILIARPGYLSTPWHVEHAAGELRCGVKPDRDNVEKATLDALTNAGVWVDDAQVCEGEVRKRYHAIGEEPGIRLTIVALPDNPMPPKRNKGTMPPENESLFPSSPES